MSKIAKRKLKTADGRLLTPFTNNIHIGEGLVFDAQEALAVDSDYIRNVVSGGACLPAVEVLDWDSTSAYIPVLSGGVCYTFLSPISALTIDTAPRSLKVATVLCNFSGGSSFIHPLDMGIIGKDSTGDGFHRIAVHANQLIVAPVSYSVDSFGVVLRSNGQVIDSMWVADAASLSSGHSMTVYTGGAVRASSVVTSSASISLSGGLLSGVSLEGDAVLSVTAGAAYSVELGNNGSACINGGMISSIDVGSGGAFYVYSGANIYDVDILQGGKLGYFGWDEDKHWDDIYNGVVVIDPLIDIHDSVMSVGSGAVLSGLTVFSGGSAEVNAISAIVDNINISSGGVLNLILNQEDFVTSDYTVFSGSSTNIAAGTLRYSGAAFAGECSGGGFKNLSGTYRIAIGDGIRAASPVVGNSDTGKARIYVHNGAVVSGAHIGISGDIDVFSGAEIKDTTVGGYSGDRYQCELTIYGGTASNVTVLSNGFVNCLSAGAISGAAVVYGGGSARLYSSSYAGNIIVHSGATLRASGSSFVEQLTMSGGTAWISACDISSAYLSGISPALRPTIKTTATVITSLTVDNRGAVNVSSGTLIKHIRHRYGYVIAKDAVIAGGSVWGSDFVVSSGGTVTNIVKMLDPARPTNIVVYAGGVVSELKVANTQSGDINTVAAYGVLTVSGGYVKNTEISNIAIYSGGLLDGLVPKKVAVSGSSKAFVGSLHVYSGGTALNVVSRSGYVITVDSGGVLSTVTILG